MFYSIQAITEKLWLRMNRNNNKRNEASFRKKTNGLGMWQQWSILDPAVPEYQGSTVPEEWENKSHINKYKYLKDWKNTSLCVCTCVCGENA